MEYAQALILTNALGGLSSLGQASAPEVSVHSYASARLWHYGLKFCIQGNSIRIRIFERESGMLSARSRGPREVLGRELEEMLPGRLIVASEHKYFAFPLFSVDDHLVASLSPACLPHMIGVELFVDGEMRQSAFVRAESCQ